MGDHAHEADAPDTTGPDDRVTPRGAWTRAEMETFLADAVVPIRLGCATPAGGLWMLSLWYRYRDDAFYCATAASADIVSYLDADDRVSFEVSVNEPPYRGVRGYGHATIEPDPEKELLRALLQRYLGGTDSSLADRLLDESREEVTIRIDPKKLYCWDYTGRMRDAAE
jgi:nitroimidazol reductase NimA-like FMN-containing flavoprotein (pyridoxamine 5'-phosphate oxidase superfamily)